MRRVVIRRPGGFSALELITEPDPEPGPGQVRVRVAAAGVNFADCWVRMGYYDAAKGLYPLTPGFEFAGTVEAAAPGSGSFAPGDRVVGVSRFGAYADRVCVGVDRLWPIPEGWTDAEAAGFPAVFMTAYHGLLRVARCEPGETVLVHSAAGGAGGAFVQLARIRGCRVIGVVGTADKVKTCKDYGADEVIDRSRQDVWVEASRLAPAGFDAIFDANGVTSLPPGYQRLAPGGRLVVYGFSELLPRGGSPDGKPAKFWLAWRFLKVPKFSPLDMTGKNRAVCGFNVVYLTERADLLAKAVSDLMGWVREGRIRKFPVTAFPLERAADAHRALESGTTQGKLVLTA